MFDSSLRRPFAAGSGVIVKSIVFCLSLISLVLSVQPGLAGEQPVPSQPAAIDIAPSPTEPLSAGPSPPPEGSQAPTPLPGNVAATVNGREISTIDYYSALVELIGDTALNFLITQMVVDQALRARGLEIDQNAVDARLAAIEQQVAPNSLEDYIRSTGLTDDIFQSVIRSGIGTETLMRAEAGIPPDAPFPANLNPEQWFRDGLLPTAQIERTKETAPDGVAAVVNGEKIPSKHWLHYCRELAADANEARLLQQLIDEELVHQELEKANVVISEQDAEEEIAVQKKLFEEDPRSGDMSFQEYLLAQGQTLESLKQSQAFLFSLGAQRLIAAELPEDEIQQYFEGQKERLGEKLVRARHILVRKLDPETQKPDFDKALAEIKQLRTQIENGAEFGAVAAGHTEDVATRNRGGDLGYFARGRMVPQFADVAFSLDKGELSQPVKTEYGYHLILVIDIVPARDVALEEVRDRIVREMVSLRRQDWILSLRAAANVRKNVAMFGPGVQ